MNKFEYLPTDRGTIRALFGLMGGADRLLLAVSPDGHVSWLTAKAAALLDLRPMAPLLDALDAASTEAVLAAAREGGWLELETAIDEVYYRLRGCPAPTGLLLELEPLDEAEEPTVRDRVRSLRYANILTGMLSLSAAEREKEKPEDEKKAWTRMHKLAQRAHRTYVHSEILGGERYLNALLEPLDLAGISRRIAAEVIDRTGIPVRVAPETFPAVYSREEFAFLVANLLTNAAACEPSEITVELRRLNGRICFSVSDTAGALRAERLGEVLDDLRGSASSCSDHELARKGMGLPAVRKVLGLRSGVLIADVAEGKTAFLASFPGDLEEDSPDICQEAPVPGYEDLIETELSVL